MTATAPKSIHQLIYGIAKIKPLTAIAGIELARAEIKGLPESLAHERPGQMFRCGHQSIFEPPDCKRREVTRPELH